MVSISVVSGAASEKTVCIVECQGDSQSYEQILQGQQESSSGSITSTLASIHRKTKKLGNRVTVTSINDSISTNYWTTLQASEDLRLL